MKKDITELFCFVDDFEKMYEETMRQHQLAQGKQIKCPTRTPGLTCSEIATILLIFQQSPIRNFKAFYLLLLSTHYKRDFPLLPTYERFVSLMPRTFGLFVILLHCLFSKSRGISYIDATSLAVCHNKRIFSHKVFQGLVARGKTTKGWFFGFKLHIIINEKAELVRVKLTKGNVDDRTVVPSLTSALKGLLFGDKGYISEKLFLTLYRQGLKLVTGIKKNMENMPMILREKFLLRKRSLIETVFDYLKNKFQIEHTRHRSPINAFIHHLSTLIAYQMRPTKPAFLNSYALPNP
jgi:hypothetical protein